MIDDEIKIISIAMIFAMGVITVYPIFSTIVIIEPHSEIGVLGPNGKIGEYPTNIKTGDPIRLFIYVGNNEGRAQYYRIIVQLVPTISINNSNNTKMVNVQTIDTFYLFLMSGQNNTIPINFSISQPNNSTRLTFELYTYNLEAQNFVYRNRNQLWLNVT
jgi:uncharacterized membrane protein